MATIDLLPLTIRTVFVVITKSKTPENCIQQLCQYGNFTLRKENLKGIGGKIDAKETRSNARGQKLCNSCESGKVKRKETEKSSKN